MLPPLGVAVLLEVPTCPPSHTQTGGVGPLWVPVAPPHPVGHTVLHKLCFIGGSQSRMGKDWGGGNTSMPAPSGTPSSPTALSSCSCKVKNNNNNKKKTQNRTKPP